MFKGQRLMEKLKRRRLAETLGGNKTRYVTKSASDSQKVVAFLKASGAVSGKDYEVVSSTLIDIAYGSDTPELQELFLELGIEEQQ